MSLKALVNEDTLLPMMFLGLRKLGNICCGHKMFLNKIRNIFVSRTQNLCPNKCCARWQTGKHLCRQQCVRNNVSSCARALTTGDPKSRNDGTAEWRNGGKLPQILKDGIAESWNGGKYPQILKDGIAESRNGRKYPQILKDGMMENHPKS